MIMKRYLIFAILSALSAHSCYDDKGNYDYRDINEVTISGVERSYSIAMDVGSLVVDPVVEMTQQNPDDPRFEYSWVVKSGDTVLDTIGRARKIEWRATLPVANYSLYFKIHDRVTGITDEVASSLGVVTYHGRGIMLIGENAAGNVQAQMIVMLPGQEPVFYDDILQYSELPVMQGPISFFHSGNVSSLASGVRKNLWIATESGSYFLNNLTLKAEPNYSTFDAFFPFDPGHRLDLAELAPAINNPNGNTASGGSYRYFLCSNGDIYGSYYFLTGDEFDAPLNILPNSATKVPASGPLLYGMVSTQTNVLWYDRAGERFIQQGSPLTLKNCTLLNDRPDDIFPFNQSGRTYVYGDNTRMTDQGGTGGNSFAVMRETTVDPARNHDYCIYKIYCAATPVKQGFFTVDKDEAPDFGASPTYAFSSTRSVVFYMANGKLNAYDYNPVVNRNYEIALADNNEVTMVKYDRQYEPAGDYLYVATHSASSGGTLYKYRLDPDLNTVELESAPVEKWTGLARISNMSWRGGE
jgi:hypothetical protein